MNIEIEEQFEQGAEVMDMLLESESLQKMMVGRVKLAKKILDLYKKELPDGLAEQIMLNDIKEMKVQL